MVAHIANCIHDLIARLEEAHVLTRTEDLTRFETGAIWERPRGLRRSSEIE